MYILLWATVCIFVYMIKIKGILNISHKPIFCSRIINGHFMNIMECKSVTKSKSLLNLKLIFEQFEFLKASSSTHT